MDKEVEEIIKKQLEKLPPEVRNLFADPSVNEKIIEIGKKNGLNVEELGTLQLETYLVMLGLTHPEDYTDELDEKLKKDPEIVDNIVNDINKEILSGIRVSLTQLHKEKEAPASAIEPKISPEKQDSKNLTDAQILGDAGIKIISRSSNSTFNNITPVVKENTAPAQPWGQKLSNSYQMPNVKSDHSLNNSPRGATLEELKKVKELPSGGSATPQPAKSAPTIITDIKPKTVIYPKGSDPYRLSPED